MIYGSGIIADALINIDDKNVVFYTSLIDNSMETDIDLFKKDENLFTDIINEYINSKIILFSTTSIYDLSKSQSHHVLHKIKLELLLKKRNSNYLILRVSNEVGFGGSESLLLNYIAKCFKDGIKLNIYTKASRNLIDKDDVIGITQQILRKNPKENLCCLAYIKNFSMETIIYFASKHFKKNIPLEYLDKGAQFQIPISPIVYNYFSESNKLDEKKYLESLLSKYY